VIRPDLQDESGRNPFLASGGNGQEFGAFAQDFKFVSVQNRSLPEKTKALIPLSRK
jgi:hypothetical protein